MIQVYCQYSFGGYRIYKIDGIAEEPLGMSKEVTIDNSLGYPDGAEIFFDRGGTKVAYRHLGDKLVLSVKEIPSLDRDSDGRPINCAVQFIGDPDDRCTLDNMSISICNDLKAFEHFFAGLFYIRSGFRIEGDKLSGYISSFERKIQFSGESPLLKIKTKKSEVILFVPLSDSFVNDSFVRTKTMEELQFSAADMKQCLIIPYSELAHIQGLLLMKSEASGSEDHSASGETSGSVGNDTETDSVEEKDIAALKSRIAGLENEGRKLRVENGDLKKKCESLLSDNKRLQEENGRLSGAGNPSRIDSSAGSLAVYDENCKKKYEECKKFNRVLLYSLGIAAVIIFILLLIVIF